MFADFSGMTSAMYPTPTKERLGDRSSQLEQACLSQHDKLLKKVYYRSAVTAGRCSYDKAPSCRKVVRRISNPHLSAGMPISPSDRGHLYQAFTYSGHDILLQTDIEMCKFPQEGHAPEEQIVCGLVRRLHCMP